MGNLCYIRASGNLPLGRRLRLQGDCFNKVEGKHAKKEKCLPTLLSIPISVNIVVF